MRITYFNARLREGGDHALILLISERVKFQSTPPRRRRLYPKYKSTAPIIFQSTPPRRRRLLASVQGVSIFTFQSTPPRRRRHCCQFFGVNLLIFSIHASAKEATCIVPPYLALPVFQSTPPRRRRPSMAARFV